MRQERSQRLRRLIQKLASEVAELRGLVHGLAQPRQQAPTAPAAPRLPAFDPGEIPDEILEGMLADDPKVRKQAVQALGAGLGARAVHMAHNLSQQMMQQFVTQRLGSLIHQQVEIRDQMRQWHDNFYGEYEASGALAPAQAGRRTDGSTGSSGCDPAGSIPGLQRLAAR